MDPLIREYLRGSERAKDLLVQRYSPSLESLRKRFPDLDPGDALSEAMLAVDRALPGVDWGNAPTAYLAGAVNERLRSKERDARRRLNRGEVSLEAPIGEEGASLGDLMGGEPNPIEAVEVHVALSRLHPAHRRAIKLIDLGDGTMTDVARRYGRVLGRGEAVYQRARESFARAMSESAVNSGSQNKKAGPGRPRGTDRTALVKARVPPQLLERFARRAQARKKSTAQFLRELMERELAPKKSMEAP